jgi:hypothetical protein
MAGRIWSAVVAIGLVLAVSALTTSTTAATDTGLERVSSSPAEVAAPGVELDVVPAARDVARVDGSRWLLKARSSLAVMAIVAVLGVAGTLVLRRPVDGRRVAPTRVRRHVIVSRGPPSFATS